MADTVTKRALITFQTDAEKAAKEVARLKDELVKAKDAEKEAKAAGDASKLAMLDKERALRAAQAAQKEANAATKAAEAALKANAAEQAKNVSLWKQATEAIDKQALKLVSLQTAVELAGKAWNAAKQALSDLIRAGEEYDGVVGGLLPRVRSLSAEVDGLISDKALARLVEYGKEMGWTEREVHSLAKASVHYSRVAKVDTAAAVQKLTDTVVNASKEGIRPFGIDLDVSSNKSVAMNQILAEMVKRFGDVTVAAENAGERADQLAHSKETLLGVLGKVIVSSETYKRLQGEQASMYRMLSNAVDVYSSGLANATSRQVEQLNRLARVALIAGQATHWAMPFGPALRDRLQALEQTTRGIASQRAETEKQAAAARRLVDINQTLQRTAEALAKAEVKRVKTTGRALQEGESDWWRFSRNTVAAERVRRLQLAKEWAEATKGVRDSVRAQAREHEAADKAAAKAHAAKIKRLKDEQAERDKARDSIRKYTDAVASAMVAEIQAGANALDTARAVGRAVTSELASKAAGKMAWHAAEALALMGRYWSSWGADAGALKSAGFHAAAAAGFGALAGGAAYLGSTMSSSSGGGSVGSAASTETGGSASSSASSSGSSSSSSGGVKSVQNYYLKGRAGLVSRKDLKRFAAKLNSGRAT